MKNDEQIISDLLLENEQLRTALSNLVVNVVEDVPAESMTKHLITAINEAEDLLTDLSDIDYEGARLGVEETEE